MYIAYCVDIFYYNNNLLNCDNILYNQLIASYFLLSNTVKPVYIEPPRDQLFCSVLTIAWFMLVILNRDFQSWNTSPFYSGFDLDKF